MTTRSIPPIPRVSGNTGSSASPKRPPGFALVTTLSLMILLTIAAVGLLTLSSIALSSSSRGSDMMEARASARLGLMLAINQLQTHAGSDQRVTVMADQIAADPSNGSTPKALESRRKWTGVYDSWNAASAQRPTPSFRSWLVSGSPQQIENLATPNGASGLNTEIVGKGTVGDTDPAKKVEVPLIEQSLGAKGKIRMAWWVGDEGVKAHAPSRTSEPPNGTSGGRIAMQAAPRFGLEVMKAGTGLPFENFDHESENNRKLVSWAQTSLAASSPAAVKPLFHDVSSNNRGLLVNVRAGGFRKDLSMFLQTSTTPKTPLYSVGGRSGINMAELWTYHNLSGELVKSTGSTSYTTGGKMPADAVYLQPRSSQSAFGTDKFHFQKQPVYIRFQTVLSFSSIPVPSTTPGTTNYRLGIVVDPIVTLWNPLDVPLVLTGTWNSVKYWPIPYDIIINANGAEYRVPFRFIVGTSSVPQYLTMRTGTDPLVLKPGEIMVYSQGANTPTVYSSGQLQFINGKPGWNFGGGMFYDYKNNDPAATNRNPLVEGPGSLSFNYRVEPNATVSLASQHWALKTHGIYYKEDRSDSTPRRPDAAPGGSTESLHLGTYSIDNRNGQPYDDGSNKPDNLRIRANAPEYRDFFDRIGSGTGSITLQEVSNSVGNKKQFMIFTFAVKTEVGADNPGRYFARYNPRATTMDFFDIRPNELRTLPFEIQISRPQSGLDPVIDVSSDGSAYFGGGWTIQNGTKAVITHSVPRHPPVSLAAFQHSAANGFVPDNSSGRVDNRNFLLPQISHAIGNSLAPSILAPDATEGALGGPRPLADHSYLANQALWDEWFLSGISPQTSAVFTNKRNQRTVAQDFLNGKPLPVRHYKADLQGKPATDVLGKWFSGSNPRTGSENLTASSMFVEGMFNVNSTSVEAWKSLLSSLRKREIPGQAANGGDATITPGDGTPNTSLLSPLNLQADANSTEDRRSTAQWAGVRVLTDGEIEALAKAIVIEVRKRGPFLSLADFVNRRVGTDKKLALSGAIQSALDSDTVPINENLRKGGRATTGSEDGLAFPEAERGAAAYGIPGYVKQADILTPIAPLLSARSDTFVIRGYGEKLDSGGRVLARAWCEAIVSRSVDFVDPSDESTKLPAQLKPVNQTFGRRFEIMSFRWLNSEEV